jgi:uncharacterized RDD family membrane protein YckC
MTPFGKRIAARFIDCWLLGATLVTLWGFGFHLATSDCNGVSRCYGFAGFGIALVIVVFGAVATILYDFVGLAGWGRTIGKSAFGLRVTRLDGSRPRTWQCLVRALAVWLSPLVLSAFAIYALASNTYGEPWKSPALDLSALYFGTTMLLMAFGRRPIHDWAAGTQVVYAAEREVTSVSPKRGWSNAAKIAGAITFAATAVGVGVLVWASIATGGHSLSESERQSYIQDNERLLESLPQIPGAQRLEMQLNPYCTNGAIIGYITNANYRTPAQMSSQDIVDFYVRNLGDVWQYTVTNTPLTVPPGADHPYGAMRTLTDVRFKRSSATIWVNIGYSSPSLLPDFYGVSVDSHRAGSVSCHED